MFYITDHHFIAWFSYLAHQISSTAGWKSLYMIAEMDETISDDSYFFFQHPTVLSHFISECAYLLECRRMDINVDCNIYNRYRHTSIFNYF